MIKLLMFGKYYYKGIITKKFYYGPIVLGLAALAVGTQVGDATTVLATEDKTEVAGKTDETKDTDTEKETAKSTYGTFEEATKTYTEDFKVFEDEINSMNGSTELSDFLRDQLAEAKTKKITDGKTLQENVYNLRVLNMDLNECLSVDVTVKDGDSELTAENVPYQIIATAGHGDQFSHDFQPGVKDIIMSDGSKLSVSFVENGGDILKAELTKDGETKDVPADSISTSASSKYQQAVMYFSLSSEKGKMGLYDQSNEAVQNAIKNLPSYLDWMRNDAKTATAAEIVEKEKEAVAKYVEPTYSLIPSPEVFPNPDGTTYTPETDSGKDNPGTDTPSNPDKPSKPSTNTNSNYHNSSNNNNTNTDKDNTTKPEEKPTDEKTVVEHRTVFVTSTTKNVQLYTDDGNLIKNRALGKDSSWVGDKMMTLNGVRYIRVATNEWAKLDDGLEITSINETVKTKNQAQLYTATGEIVKNRALAGNTAWYSDRVATINGQKMYRVSTNEWVAANDIK